MQAFDFHLHTTASDGACGPAEVFRRAREAGLSGIAITDHDTIDALDALAGDGGMPASPWVLPGIEVSTRLGAGEVHILGYFPAGLPAGLRAYAERIIAARRRRIAAGITRLRERGIDIAWEDCARVATGRVVSRSHVARILVAKRYAGRAGRAYRDFLGPDVVPLPDEDARDAVRTLRSLGGIAVWAHPSREQLAAGLDELVAAGLEGLEVLTPRRTRQEMRDVGEAARRKGLLATGGSDWHGNHGGPELGTFRVGEASVEDFLARLGKRCSMAPSKSSR